MLPFDIAKICSLTENEFRHSLALSLEINGEGIIDYDSLFYDK
jgi:hypothetical protein